MAAIVVVPKTKPMSLVQYTGHNEAEIQEFTGLETAKAQSQNGSPVAFMFHDAGPRMAQVGYYVNKYGMSYSEDTIKTQFDIVPVLDV